MADDFKYDVFLSHSSKDKAVVRDLAKRLQADGLRVWFDEWEIKPGDSIPAKIEEGLEHSRVLVLCMSADAFGADWAQLEAGTFRFRDPLNKERRFIPLRLDDAPIKGSLAQFLHIDWQPDAREQAYVKLLEACRATGSPLSETDQLGRPTPDPPAQHAHDLRISIHPTRNRLRQLAQIQLFNAAERPILIDGWFVEWSDKSASVSVCCEQGTLPVRLEDHERAELIVDLSDHPVEELGSLGVTDAEGRFWHAQGKNLRRFIYTAKLYEPPRLDTQPHQPCEPSEVRVSACVCHPNGPLETRLEVRLRNLGPRDLEPHSARVEWQFVPPREMPRDPGEPEVAEAGGSISLRYDKRRKFLKPNQEGVFLLGLHDPLAQGIVQVLAPDVTDENLCVTVNASHWEWTAQSSEVPEVIRQFARVVLSALHRAP